MSIGWTIIGVLLLAGLFYACWVASRISTEDSRARRQRDRTN